MQSLVAYITTLPPDIWVIKKERCERDRTRCVGNMVRTTTPHTNVNLSASENMLTWQHELVHSCTVAISHHLTRNVLIHCSFQKYILIEK